ncbi:unnamed protein product [Colias eurytheme]|nr:unnamed protein product [Colias eurytheme]
MDTDNNKITKNKSKRNRNKNAKKKEMERKDEVFVDKVASDVKGVDNEVNISGSPSSTDSEDLVNAINYNTITSLAALKDIIQGENNDTPETDSFFQHYFMNHCNNLSSRNSNSTSPFPYTERRRLSQCREEDEDDYRKDNSVSNSPSKALHLVDSNKNDNKLNKSPHKTESLKIDNKEDKDPSKRTVMGAKHKFLVTTAETPPAKLERAFRTQVNNAHTVHFGTKGAEELRPSVRSIFAGENLHRDKNYFDSSLIEIRSTVDGVATSSEDIWVKRTNDKQVVLPKEDVATTEDEGKTKLAVDTEKPDKVETQRARSGTWGSQSHKEKDIIKITDVQKLKEVRRYSDDRRQKREQRLDAAITRSTQSVGERRRRSADDGHSHQFYQQTIHGTSGVSRRPALFDIFKSRPRGADSKKQPSFMQQVKNAMQNMTKAKEPIKTDTKQDLTKPDGAASSTTASTSKVKDGSAHPHPGSDTKYYHTITVPSNRRPSAINKVMDLFRGRASIPGQPAEVTEKRQRRAVAQPHHHAGEF